MDRPTKPAHLIAPRLAENLEHEPRCDHLFILTWRLAVARADVFASGISTAPVDNLDRITAGDSDHSHPPEQEGAAGDDGGHGDRQGDYLAPNDAGGLRLGAGRVRAVGKAAHNETIPGSR
jgi:hypothetical protein